MHSNPCPQIIPHHFIPTPQPEIHFRTNYMDPTHLPEPQNKITAHDRRAQYMIVSSRTISGLFKLFFSRFSPTLTLLSPFYFHCLTNPSPFSYPLYLLRDKPRTTYPEIPIQGTTTVIQDDHSRRNKHKETTFQARRIVLQVYQSLYISLSQS